MEPSEYLDYILAGENGFKLFCRDADLPTDTSLVLEKIIHESRTNRQMTDLLPEALIRLSARNDIGWLVMYYLLDVAIWEKAVGAKLLHSTHLDTIATNLELRRTDWLGNKNWVGSQMHEGIWGDVCQLKAILCNNYLICLAIDC